MTDHAPGTVAPKTAGETHACVCWTKRGDPCPHEADRFRAGGWFCHLHDPEGAWVKQHPKSMKVRR